MNAKATNVSSDQFLKNLLELKNSLRNNLPSDALFSKCDKCLIKFPVSHEGIIQVKSPLDKDLDIVINELVRGQCQSYNSEGKGCSGNMIILSDETPQNVLVSIPESNIEFIKTLNIAEESYQVQLMVTKIESSKDAIFVLFQKENVDDKSYLDFLQCNFQMFLDIIEKDKEEDTEKGIIIYDDESVNLNRQYLTRLSGGGRKINTNAGYECIWCTKKEKKVKTYGKFREYRTYKSHFIKYHEGKDNPLSDFLRKVKRSEPTWFCEKCQRHVGLPNKSRHQSVCKIEQDLSDAETDDGGRNATNLSYLETDDEES